MHGDSPAFVLREPGKIILLVFIIEYNETPLLWSTPFSIIFLLSYPKHTPFYHNINQSAFNQSKKQTLRPSAHTAGTAMADIASVRRRRWERFTSDSLIEADRPSAIAAAKGNDDVTDGRTSDKDGAMNVGTLKKGDGVVDDDIIPSEFECVLCLRCDFSACCPRSGSVWSLETGGHVALLCDAGQFSSFALLVADRMYVRSQYANKAKGLLLCDVGTFIHRKAKKERSTVVVYI